MHILRRKYPIKATLRNGNQAILHTRPEVYSIAGLQGHEGLRYDIINDIVTILFQPYAGENQIEVKLHGGITNGDISNIFINNIYGALPVEGKTVIDIGMNIGDSCIYFALRGADKIVGLEPSIKNFEIAKKNIKLNNLTNRITMHFAGCAAKSGYGFIHPDYKSNFDSYLVDEFKHGIKIPLRTLDNILNEHNLLSVGAILKMDCEGCEYECVLDASEDTLQKFSYILVEYHYGYKNLKEKLEKCGFSVSVTKPMTDLSYKPKMVIGYIYAERK